jgi:hypothetical protein
MLEQVVHGMGRIGAGVLIGAAPGALYAGLVGAVHLGVSGRWDRIPAFAIGCVLVGALFGLLGGIRWALSGEAGPESLLPTANRPAASATVGWLARRHPRRPGAVLGKGSRRRTRCPDAGFQVRPARLRRLQRSV